MLQRERNGFRPPINVQADKGTTSHRTRQFTFLVTVVPDSPDLLVFIYLGQPVVLQHDEKGVSQSIIEQMVKWNLQPGQVEGGSFDGQFFHLGVPAHLTELYGLSDEFLCTWDPLHKGGVVDAHIRDDSTFKWLVDIQSLCRQIYTLFNWGKNYEDLLNTCEIQKIEYRKLTNFQTTRIANSVRFVFINLRDDYGAVRVSMKNVINAKEISSNADDRAKAGAAKTVLRNINSWVFCLCLSGCADVYDLFGIFAQICQTVN